MRELMKKKWLSCGCCGIDFRVWEGYVGQDHGSGTCKHCQKLIEEKKEHDFDTSIRKLRNRLSVKNQLKFDCLDRDFKKALLTKTLDDKALKYVIKNYYSTREW